jgi:small ligand-binding sensory domain FIST
VAGLALRLPEPTRVGVAQGARFATPAMRVTQAEGNWILGLDGRKALQVYREVAREPLAADLHRAARSLVVATALRSAEGAGGDSQVELQLDAARLRGVAGFDLRRSAFSLPESVNPGDMVALAFLDSHSARENLAATLDQLGNRTPAFGLYLGCRTRGASLFGFEGLEAGYLERVRAPTLGITGPYQIAPLGPSGSPELLTHAGVLALIDSR